MIAMRSKREVGPKVATSPHVRFAPEPDVHCTGRQFLSQLGHRRNDVCLRSPLRFRCASLNGRQPLCNGREETLYFFPQVRDRLAIAREMPQQASLEQSIKQRIEGGPGDNRLSATK